MRPAASRPAPPDIKPLLKDGTRYEARISDPGTLFAVDAETGKPKWQVKIYDYFQNPAAPTHLDVYFKSMEFSENGQSILIQDEAGIRRSLSLSDRQVHILKWPVQLQLVAYEPTPTGWKYSLKLSINNGLNRVMQLDGASVAENGNVANDKFVVTVDGKQIPFRGEMVKRGPPGQFIELAAGESYIAIVELSEAYPISAGKKKVKVAFSSRNHFSPDDFLMEARPLEFVLEGAGWKLQPKPKPPP